MVYVKRRLTKKVIFLLGNLLKCQIKRITCDWLKYFITLSSPHPYYTSFGTLTKLSLSVIH